LCGATFSAPLKLFPDFGTEANRCRFLTCYLGGMSLLRERSRRSVWERDWKKDHWLAQASFGFLLVVLAAWLVVRYWGAPLVF
jgi:hypothetical protein